MNPEPHVASASIPDLPRPSRVVFLADPSAQEVLVFNTHMKIGCLGKTRLVFQRTLRIVHVSHKKTVHVVVNKLKTDRVVIRQRGAESIRRLLTKDRATGPTVREAIWHKWYVALPPERQNDSR
jgi:hypothetical protein